MTRFAFEWTRRRDANDADEKRGIDAADAYCTANGIDADDAYAKMLHAIEQWPQSAADLAAIDKWAGVEGAAVAAMCKGWVSTTENATLIRTA